MSLCHYSHLPPMTWYRILLIVFLFCVSAEDRFDLQKDNGGTFLLLSLLDGSLIGLERDTGQPLWKIQDEPVVRVPMNINSVMPLFLPDPKDGSLYIFGSNDREALQKLPFTIPQLVASSPCRGSDGIIYTGKKVDTWFSINPHTGTKKSLLNSKGFHSTCPKEGPESVFIGRTEYNILMMDTLRNQKMWNVTFYDYASFNMDEESTSLYDLVHFTGSSSGRVLTVSRDTGVFKWQSENGSPVIGMYLLQNRGLLRVPFTSIAESTLDSLIDEVNLRRTSRLGLEFKPHDLKLLPTLYVGEHIHGLYALPSLVDQNTATIEMARRGQPLIEGPTGPGPDHDQPISRESSGPPVVVLGHYKMPDYSKTRLQIAGGAENSTKEINGRNSVAVQTDGELNESKEEWIIWDALLEILHGNVSVHNLNYLGKCCWKYVQTAVAKQENLEIKAAMVVVIVFVCAVAWRLHRQMQDIQQMSQGSKRSETTGGSQSSIQIPEETSPGVITVGKITLFTDQVLGKGCEGTFVFRGLFDSRPVAVKRVLPECFSFADREVDLLRESDAHPNVVRYFCTEQDKQFRYIALELCAATVHDYVQGTYTTTSISPMQVLLQATQGLAHLHSLHIVHRDVKPHNVLLSMESQQGEVRAMISDFGLCKKLQMGRASFSRRSGVTGTDGWIAPEMANGEIRATCAVDVFSMGCVYYYVLTLGKHPFGDNLHRQANILNGESNLNGLQEDNRLAITLISQMISLQSNSRPYTSAILKHPFFWKQDRILAFFQDVSDRVEKEPEDSPVLKRLEELSGVVKGDWRSIIDSEVAEDLRKYRNYRGDSVRDLLRALRNKKHHYRELSEQAQKNLGEIPLEFVDYWTTRFPLLLLHTWLAMQSVKREPIFRQYYDTNYIFPRLPHQEIVLKPLEMEGFSIRRPSLTVNWRAKQNEIADTNWRALERRASEPKPQFDINLFNDDLYKNQWFTQWYLSDFRDNNAFIQWREQEFYRRLSFQENPQPFQPEFPPWELCERLRKDKRIKEEDEQQGNMYKKSSPRKVRRRPSKKPAENHLPVWTLPPSQ